MLSNHERKIERITVTIFLCAGQTVWFLGKGKFQDKINNGSQKRIGKERKQRGIKTKDLEKFECH